MGKMGTACIILGTALILGALSLFLFNRLESEQAGAAAKNVLPRIIEEILEPNSTDPAKEPSYPDPYDPAMTEVEIDGYAYVGYVSIPALELELPVMANWDYSRLKIAPCRYTGSTKTDDLVLCAHNYTQHFGSLKGLTDGDAVIFTDMDGVVWRYEVVVVDVLSATAVQEMESGEYDLTLFTCTYDGVSRVTVRCDRVED